MINGNCRDLVSVSFIVSIKFHFVVWIFSTSPILAGYSRCYRPRVQFCLALNQPTNPIVISANSEDFSLAEVFIVEN